MSILGSGSFKGQQTKEIQHISHVLARKCKAQTMRYKIQTYIFARCRTQYIRTQLPLLIAVSAVLADTSKHYQ